MADPARGGLPRFILIARLSKVEMLNGSEVVSDLFGKIFSVIFMKMYLLIYMDSWPCLGNIS